MAYTKIVPKFLDAFSIIFTIKLKVVDELQTGEKIYKGRITNKESHVSEEQRKWMQSEARK